MKKIKKEFMVDYLENLCALHIVQQKLESKYDQMIDEKQYSKKKLSSIKAPEPPEKKSAIGLIFLALFGIFVIIISGVDAMPTLLSWFFAPCGWFITIVYGIWAVGRMIKNAMLQSEYDSAYEKYSAQWDEESDNYDSVTEYANNNIAILDKRINEVKAALAEMYSANIISRPYRNIYAAMYFYDWFATGSSDDLDMAINTYVLEEIKERLDIIIEQQSQMLINDKIIIANQYRTEQKLEAYHNKMINKMDKMQMSMDEQNECMRIIESNTRAMAYFSAADYLKNIFK